MKKLTLIFLALFLAACATPQASHVQPTSVSLAQPTTPQAQSIQTPLPEPTSTPTTGMAAFVTPAAPAAGEKLSFESIDMSDQNIGWGIDIIGRIFHTTDGGQTWMFASPPDGVYTSGGFFALDGNTAWAAKDVPVRCWDYLAIYQCSQPYYAAVKNGTVWKTIDGGQTWQPSQHFSLNIEKAPYSFDGALPFSPAGLQFIDPQTGWLLVAVGQTPAGEQSLLYQTNDSGATWNVVQTFGFKPDVYSCHKLGVTFTNVNNGWLVLDCTMQEINAPEGESNPFPMVLHTTDGGSTWSPDSQILDVPIPSELQIDEANGYVRYDPSLSREHVQRYPDGSLGVHLLHSDDQLLTFFRLGNQMVDKWISGIKFYKTLIDEQRNPISIRKGGWMTMGSEYFLDTNHGWRLYWDMSTDGRWLQKTADGGQTWESTKAVAWIAARFEFVDAQTGWAIVIGQAGLPSLVKTLDGGGTWDLLAGHVTGGEVLTDNNPSVVVSQDAQLVNIAEIWMIDSSAGWAMIEDEQLLITDNERAVINNSRLLRTTDGAQTWHNVTPPAEYKAYQNQCRYDTIVTYGGLKPDGFFALDANTAWVAQHGCAPASIAVWKTTNGGQSWRKIPLGEIPPQPDMMPAFFAPISLSFDDASHGWLAADLYAGNRSYDGYLFRTQDGGESWQLVSNETLECYPYCVGAAFRAPGTIWLADDPRLTPADSNYLFFSYSDDGGSTWKQRALFDTTPTMPSESAYSSRTHMPNWDDGFYCGSTRLTRFSTETVGANSDCYDSSRSFFVSYLTLIDNNSQLKTTIDGIGAGAEMGKYYGSGGWTTNQSEFFYNNQLGWRLYSGAGMDANGAIYLQRTQDGGATWQTIMPVLWQNARFQFLNPQNGWALVTLPWGNAVVKTTNGGQTWEELKPVIVKP